MTSWLIFIIGLLAAELVSSITRLPRLITYPAVLLVVYIIYISGALPAAGGT